MNYDALFVDCFTSFAMTMGDCLVGTITLVVFCALFNCPHEKVRGRKRNNLLIRNLTKPRIGWEIRQRSISVILFLSVVPVFPNEKTAGREPGRSGVNKSYTTMTLWLSDESCFMTTTPRPFVYGDITVRMAPITSDNDAFAPVVYGLVKAPNPHHCEFRHIIHQFRKQFH